jgi:hypothetical protein
MDNKHQAAAPAAAAAASDDDDNDDDDDDDDNDNVETENTGMFFALVLRSDFRELISERDFMSVECFSLPFRCEVTSGFCQFEFFSNSDINSFIS